MNASNPYRKYCFQPRREDPDRTDLLTPGEQGIEDTQTRAQTL
jgi:hypothetical protein